MAGPKLYDPTVALAAGLNPKTGLLCKYDGQRKLLWPDLADDINRCIRIMDEQDAINRFVWYNLPSGLTGQMIERVLYYKGQGAFFYLKNDDNFYFLPYALDGDIDIYGRFKGITPLPFTGTAADAKGAWITGLTFKPVYSMDEAMQAMNDSGIDGICFLLSDYSKQLSQTNIPRQILNDCLCKALSEAFPMARTSLIANSGISGIQVVDQDQAAQVVEAAASVNAAALSGQPWVPIVSGTQVQPLTAAGSAMKSEEYLLYMQALDNFRLSLYGLKNGGLFQKKAHLLQAEEEMNNGNLGLIMQDSLTNRQVFCDLVNMITGIMIWCEPSEAAVGIDRNGDMMVGDEQDQNGQPGEQPAQVGGEDND